MHVLVIDDHPDAREVLSQMLVIHGHSVSTAGSARRAWEEIDKHLPQLIVIDQRMDGVSGLEMLAQIRAQPHLQEIRVVLCSGDQALRLQALADGAADFWLKGSDEMFEAIAKLDGSIPPGQRRQDSSRA